MKGLALSKAYAIEYGIPMLAQKFPEYMDKMAVGLVGEGSECFGYDDEFSKDHDFGAGFCIWVSEELYSKIGKQIQIEYDALPQNYQGYRRIITPNGMGRVGVMSIERFYMRYLGIAEAPQDNLEWIRIPESFLATATNGEVFIDNAGEFSRVRSILKGFYPIDVKKKKLAARLAIMAQSGQYNYIRSQQRGNAEAAYMACAEFVKAGISAIYILNDKYMPFYKWAFKGLDGLNVLKNTASKLSELVLLSDSKENADKKIHIIEAICRDVARELNVRKYTNTGDYFLETHGIELMKTIEDSRLGNMHIMADFN